MRLFKQKYHPGKYDSLIASGCMVDGDVVYTGSIFIKGTVVGNVRAPESDAGSAVTVSGKISGTFLNADFLVIENEGTVDVTTITVRKTLIVKKGGKLNGNVTYGDISLEEGAEVTGTLSTQPLTSKPLDRGDLVANFED